MDPMGYETLLGSYLFGQILVTKPPVGHPKWQCRCWNCSNLPRFIALK